MQPTDYNVFLVTGSNKVYLAEEPVKEIEGAIFVGCICHPCTEEGISDNGMLKYMLVSNVLEPAGHFLKDPDIHLYEPE